MCVSATCVLTVSLKRSLVVSGDTFGHHLVVLFTWWTVQESPLPAVPLSGLLMLVLSLSLPDFMNWRASVPPHPFISSILVHYPSPACNPRARIPLLDSHPGYWPTPHPSWFSIAHRKDLDLQVSVSH